MIIKDWIQTHTGRQFYPLDPKIEAIHIEDIAHALSHIGRFNGHSERFYSVGEHSLNCLDLARSLGLSYSDRYACLLHDAGEAYLGDIPTPVKKALPQFKEAELRLEALIEEKFGIKHSPKVKEVDRIMLATERKALYVNPIPWEGLEGIEPTTLITIAEDIVPSHIIKRRFLQEFYALSAVIS